jgi:flagellar P-ring protein precursor FlgI
MWTMAKPRTLNLLFALTVFLSAAPILRAAKIADITRIDGQQNTYLTGIGLVYGLNGSCDTGEFGPAIKPLAQMLAKLKDPTTAEELAKTKNVAVVALTATLPSTGVQQGDHIDVRLSSMGNASSFKGGRLFVVPMFGPSGTGRPLALAEGAVDLEDPSEPVTGVVKGGAIMDVSVRYETVNRDGKFTLIIDDPITSTWAPASAIAQVINDAEGDDGETLAVVIDNKRVEVTIPPGQRQHPDGFISRVQNLPISSKNLITEARVVINKKKGSMELTGDVEISPVVISYKGLTISTVTPAPVPTLANPVTSTRQTVGIDTTNEGGGKLQDLIAAMEQLKVPAEDRISIVQELYRTGKLHARLVYEQD